MQVHRQLRRPVDIGPVALPKVIVEQGIDASRKPRLCALLARLPMVPELRVPRRRWRGNQRIDGDGRNRRIDFRQRFRRWRERSHIQVRARIAPERGEHAIRIALLRRDRPRLAQQCAVVAFDVQIACAQCVLHRCIARDGCGFVTATPINGFGAGVFDESFECRETPPSRRINRDPRARSDASSAISECRNHASDAAPGDQGASSSGACT